MTAVVWFAPREIGDGFPADGASAGAVWRLLEAVLSMAGGAAGSGFFGAGGGLAHDRSAAHHRDWAGTDAQPAASKKNTSKQKPAAENAVGNSVENTVEDTVESAVAAAGSAQRELATDWTDIAATLDGDGQAYARIVRRYQDQITAQMWRLSRQRNDCEQLVHEVFVEAYVSLRQFKGRAPFLHWLRRIATRVGYRYWKQQARARRQAAVPLQDWHRSVPAADVGAAEETAAMVHGLLEKLPPRDRLVLTLIYLEECSVAEAAELSGWSQTMVKVQAHRARKKLKKLMEERESP